MTDGGRTDILSTAPLSMLFFTINCALYGICAYRSCNTEIDSNVLLALGASQRELLWEGEWVRLILPNFLHGGLLHILLNNMYLWSIGPSAESHFGSANFGTLYLLSGVAGFCFSQIFGGYLAIGASAALFGLLGAELCVKILRLPRVKYFWRNHEVRQQITWIVLFFLIGISGMMGPIDNWAHLGGFLVGSLLASFFEVWRLWQRLGMAMIAVVLLLLALLVGVARWSFFSPEYHVHIALLAKEEQRTAEVDTEVAAARKWAKFWGSERATECLLDTGLNNLWNLDDARQYGYKQLSLILANQTTDNYK
ncbi:MAG: rhomboid family intramembrane serine protease [Planctomycetota bacterium]